jgi:hypothetical protein
LFVEIGFSLTFLPWLALNLILSISASLAAKITSVFYQLWPVMPSSTLDKLSSEIN